MNSMTYILTTPVKNEEENLPKVIESIVDQTIRPTLWVIIDDGSTDSTPNIIKEIKCKYSWVESISLPESERKLGSHYSCIVKKGFEYAIKFTNEMKIIWNYIGILDGDIIPGTDYFEKLISKFENDTKLGIASGRIYSLNKEKELIMEYTYSDQPRGGARLWRRKCFEECGYIVGISADSIAVARAKMKGWKTRSFNNIIAIQQRITSSARGTWNGAKYWGESAYFLRYNPLFVVGKIMKYFLKKHHMVGLAFAIGYFESFINRSKRLEDDIAVQYFRKEIIRERLLKDKRIARNE